MTNENKNDDDDSINTSNASRLQRTHELISELNKLNSVVIKPSEGLPFVEARDPHLRLRRTLTLPSKFKGLFDDESQFMISTADGSSSGERRSLSFSCFGEDFVCHGYFWGACEEKATKRIFAVHGITPAGLSRTRWHSLGDRLTQEDDTIRFCAIDWHSLDRTDKPQDEFLTMLPKHFPTPWDDELLEKLYPDFPKKKCLEYFELCPRSPEQGAKVLRAIIEQGCGWGTSPEKSFILCIKSWSGGIGMAMIIDAKNEEKEGDNNNNNNNFHKNILAAVLMHPGFLKIVTNMKEVLDFPVLMCWAKDDVTVSYPVLSQQYIDAGAVIAGPTTGGHAAFPEFDDDVSPFIHNLPKIESLLYT